MAFTPTAPRRSNNASRFLDHRPSTPSNLSPFARSMSTPYSLASQRQGGGDGSGSSSSSPYNISHSSMESPAYRRNAGFGSPGRAPPRSGSALVSKGRQSGRSSLSGTPVNGDSPVDASQARRARFVRRKPLSEKLRALPLDLYDRAAMLASTSFIELLHEPALGYPLGAVLHALSLGAHIASPDSELGLLTLLPWASSRKGARSGSLFGGGTRATSGPTAADATQQLRAMAKGQTDAWWRWMAILMSLSLIALSTYNAYVLIMSRRRYSLWLRPENVPLHSESASLIDVPTLESDQSGPTWKERLRDYVLLRLSELPVLNWFVDGPQSDLPDDSRTPRMHVLSVWDPNEVQLRVFCIYSPAHALQYYLLGRLGVRTPLAWLLSLGLMVLFSAQLAFTAHLYQRLLKDKSILAAEVMNEYDQKFVLPRAMPLMRDASTSTSQAEFIASADWSTKGGGVFASPSAPSSSNASSQLNRNHQDSGKLGGGSDDDDEENIPKRSTTPAKSRTTTQSRASRNTTPRGTPSRSSTARRKAADADSIQPW